MIKRILKIALAAIAAVLLMGFALARMINQMCQKYQITIH